MKITVNLDADVIIRAARPTVEQVVANSAILSGIHDRDKQGDLVAHLISCVERAQIDNLQRSSDK